MNQNCEYSNDSKKICLFLSILNNLVFIIIIYTQLDMSKYHRHRRSRSRSRNKKPRYIDNRSSTSRHRRHPNNQRDKRMRSVRSYSSSSSSSSSQSSSSSSGSPSGSESSSAYRRHRVSHFSFKYGERLDGRYKMRKILGDGTFGRVIECHYKDKSYAVKVIKKVDKYMNSAKTERSVIKRINEKDPDDKYGILKYKESFYHEGNFCLVFYPLGKSLYQFIKMNDYEGFPMPMVQSFFKQILHSVGFLHSIGYTHTDLKPENILLESPLYYEANPRNSNSRKKYYLPSSQKIRIIDFGGATRQNEHHSSTINTRQYRSPEVILESIAWNEISDVWSIGCIICELIAGELFFPTHDDVEHLAMIEKSCGRFPPDMIEKIPRDSSLRKLFSEGLINQNRVEHIENVVGLKTLEQIVPYCPGLVDLLRSCLEIDPRRRMSCQQALQHPFFQLKL